MTTTTDTTEKALETRPPMRSRLDSMTIKGFKTIRELDDFSPRDLTVLIGPNGVGKSNFISFFRMMSWMMADTNNLPIYVGQNGGASKLLHDGPEHTREIEAELTLKNEAGRNQYVFRLVFAAGDTFIFADERYRFLREDSDTAAPWQETGVGHLYPKIIDRVIDRVIEDNTALITRTILQKIIVHQFHNTSETARIKNKWNINDNRFLKEDAGNIAPVLYRLKHQNPRYYQRIVNTLQLMLPFFSDFELEPEYNHLILRWRELNSDQVFDVSQASDGMLRTVALVTLLLLPTDELPNVLIIDEPELGLHPFAINIIGGLIKAASIKIQVIIATQSTALVDCFDPEDIVVVERNERDGRESVFRHLDGKNLEGWLEDYSLAELWQKNVIGGRP